MDRPELSDELQRLAEEDLAVRQRLADSGELRQGYHPEMQAVHRRNGDRLAAILTEVGCWPGFRMVGAAGSEAAFLIAQHDIANPALIRRCRDLLAAAVDDSDGDPARLAAMEDRIRYFEGDRQRYGTHFGWNRDGEFGPWPPVEAPETVDQRRADMGLPPLADAIAAAAVDRPARRPVEEVLAEHQKGDEFAHRSGWRTPDPG